MHRSRRKHSHGFGEKDRMEPCSEIKTVEKRYTLQMKKKRVKETEIDREKDRVKEFGSVNRIYSKT